MKKQASRRLALSRETVKAMQQLDTAQLGGVHGGYVETHPCPPFTHANCPSRGGTVSACTECSTG
jgi:hypothetical protein